MHFIVNNKGAGWHLRQVPLYPYILSKFNAIVVIAIANSSIIILSKIIAYPPFLVIFSIVDCGQEESNGLP